METDTMELLRQIGIGSSFGLSAFGAAIGVASNGPAVIGAWKKCYIQNKPAPFILTVFAGTTLSNLIYGFIIMGALYNTTALGVGMIFSLGITVGLCIGAIAITQAMCSAAAAEAYVETGKGLANNLIIVGIAETVSLIAMVFTLLYT